jgi:N-methylhydantoinase A
MGLVIATDIGGMFTDMVAFDTDSKTTVHAKSHTDPGDLTGGIIRCLQKSGLVLSEATDFVRGSTVAINTAIERKGAVTALIVTRGMRDVYAIGRGNRPEAYNLFFERPEPFVPRSRIIEIHERLDAAGNVVTPLDPQSVRDALQVAQFRWAESLPALALGPVARQGVRGSRARWRRGAHRPAARGHHRLLRFRPVHEGCAARSVT